MARVAGVEAKAVARRQAARRAVRMERRTIFFKVMENGAVLEEIRRMRVDRSGIYIMIAITVPSDSRCEDMSDDKKDPTDRYR